MERKLKLKNKIKFTNSKIIYSSGKSLHR